MFWPPYAPRSARELGLLWAIVVMDPYRNQEGRQFLPSIFCCICICAGLRELGAQNPIHNTQIAFGAKIWFLMYYFFHIQSILTACGILYNIFYGNNGWSRRYTVNRPLLLRKAFGIDKNRYPLVFDKAVRNTNEHFDERFDAFGWDIGDYNLLDHNTPPDMRTAILKENHLRTFDRSNNCYYTYVRHQGKFVQKSVDFQELIMQLLSTRKRITTNPIMESRWKDQMPGDILSR